jgi:hypothetical protein
MLLLFRVVFENDRYVSYLSRSDAQKEGLISSNASYVYIGADNKSIFLSVFDNGP